MPTEKRDKQSAECIAECTDTTKEKIEDDLHALRFIIEKSIRYHSHRWRFFDNLYNIVVAALAISGASAFALLLGNNASLAVYAAGIVSIFVTLDFVLGFNKRASLHFLLKRRFIDLQIKLENADLSKGNKSLLRKYKDILTERLSIEKDEPPFLKALDTHCHNEQCKANGDDSYMYEIHWWRGLWKHIFSFNNWQPALKTKQLEQSQSQS